MTPVPARDLATRFTHIPADITPELLVVLSSIAERLYDPIRSPGRRSVLVTSCDPRSGVSFFCSALSLCLGVHPDGVLLLPAGLAKELLENKRLLKEWQLKQLPREPVWTVHRSSNCDSNLTLLNGGDMSWRDLRNRFRYIIIDGPALNDTSVSLGLAKHVDGVVVIAVPGQTSLRDLRMAKSSITKAGGCLVGAVAINQLTASGEGL
jgi:hypothetical protein